LRVGLPRRRLPSSGFLTLSTVSSHRGLVALFHATPAHRISAFRAFPTQPAATPLGARCSRAVESAPAATSCPAATFAPAFLLPTDPTPLPSNTHLGSHKASRHGADISHVIHQRTGRPNDERPTPARSIPTGRPGEHQQARLRASGATPAGEDPDFRALLRLSSRSYPGIVRPPNKPMLSWPSPPPRPPA